MLTAISVIVGSLCVTFLVCLLVGYRVERQERRDRLVLASEFTEDEESEVVQASEPQNTGDEYDRAGCLELAPDESIEYEQSESIPEPESAGDQDNRVEDVASALRNLGHKKRDAEYYALRAVEATPGGTIEEAVVRALRSTKEPI